MSKINGSQRANAPMNTLKPQPGQYDSYNPKFHPLPGDWAKEQMNKGMGRYSESPKRSSISERTEIQKALAAEEAQHNYWEEWQGVTPGKPVYEDPRAMQNTLLPSAKYGTEGRGYG
jgi:hypothetical protein